MSITKSKGGKKQKKNTPEKASTIAEFDIYMHCIGCERTIAKAISKIKGVDKFVTDMKNHKVVIMGKIDPVQVMKKLKKKTGKAVEIVVKEEPKNEVASVEAVEAVEAMTNQSLNFMLRNYLGNDFFSTMFSDEDANACSIM